MEKIIKKLNKLVGQKVQYAKKSPDTELYDIGFGEMRKTIMYNGSEHSVSTLCRIKVVFCESSLKKQIKWFDSVSSSEEFSHIENNIIGLEVISIDVNERNCLKVDLGQWVLVFFPNGDDEESWRFFSPYSEEPHLVVSNSWIEIE